MEVIDTTNGCPSDDACVTVIVEQKAIDCSNTGELFLPNVFSPNDDRENDVLHIYFGNVLCIKELHIAIFDRWGERVFQSYDPLFTWDGTFKDKSLDTAVFVYYLEATIATGETINKKGNISLIR